MNKLELLYPIFLLCIKYIDSDNYWKIVYEELSYGKCPYGIYIKNDYLCCNYKNKKFNYKINQDKEPGELYKETYNLLKNKFGLLSDNDRLNNKNLFLLHESEIYKDIKDDWNNIKKKNIKQLFIEKYIIKNSLEYDLSEQQSNELLQLILLGILLKTITTKNIIFKNYMIEDISCISFKKNQYIFDQDLFSFKQKYIILN